MPVRQYPIAATLSAKLKAAFARTIPAPRWQAYLIAAGGDENRALCLYLWNAAVGQSFHFPLQTVEIALRNTLNSALAAAFAPDWWRNPICRTYLGPKRCAEIDKAETRLINKYGGTPTTDHIVSSLTFGFWAAITHPKLSRLWPARRFASFPNLPAALSMADVSATADNVQEMRNRIFHHEPLIGRNLLDDYAQISNLLGWICPKPTSGCANILVFLPSSESGLNLRHDDGGDDHHHHDLWLSYRVTEPYQGLRELGHHTSAN